MKIGIVVNFNAGRQHHIHSCLRRLKKVFAGAQLYCAAGSFQPVREHFPAITCVGSDIVTNSWRDSANAGYCLDFTDYIVSFGGDGTVCDIIAGQRQKSPTTRVPIAAVGCGTANAGPFIICRWDEDLSVLAPENTETKLIGGLDVYDAGGYTGTAFNDVVLSETTVSMVDGRVCTVDAREFLAGKRVEKNTGLIETADMEIFVNGNRLSLPFAFGQVVLAPVYDKTPFMHKAVTGKFSWMSFLPDKNALMIVTAVPVIQMVGEELCQPHVPLLQSQYMLGDGDYVEMRGTRGCLIIDGNPRIDMELPGAAAKIIYNSESGVTLAGRDK